MGLKAVNPKDYIHSGYDRGHMAPSADFLWSQRANDETFVMSNMVPQTPNLNQKAWSKLEAQVRRWGCGEKKITVITGPILEDNLPKLLSGIPIPRKFFKVIVDETPPKKTIAFIYDQYDAVGTKYVDRIASIDDITGKTKLRIASMIDMPAKEIRAISSTNKWKEADCSQKKPRKHKLK